MCDTFGFVNEKRAIFAKNSDRSPNECQILQYFEGKSNTENEIKLTYITIPQVKQQHAVLLSRPTWLWGAEMGVNDCGVCIGNEAVWTKGKYGKEALTGMDMLRLALERSESAKDALQILIDLLMQFGQGGNCGFDHEFFYDNSFLVMDSKELFVLETAGREWVYKSYDKASISNRLSIGSEGDAYSTEAKTDFAAVHSDILYNFASGSGERKRQTTCALKSDMSLEEIFSSLRTHNSNVSNPFSKGTVDSTCMHFGGIVGDHTTASMAVELREDKTVVWATGASLPCVSLYKPWIFGESPNHVIEFGEKYFWEQEKFRRSLIGKKIPDEYYIKRDEIEESWISCLNAGERDLYHMCYIQEKEFYDYWSKYTFENAATAPGYMLRWGKKNSTIKMQFSE